jgi:Tfp pilus assembly protein PilE
VSVSRLAQPHNSLTFLEIGLVVAVIGIAAAVAVPEYLNLRQDARDDAARTRLAAAARTLEVRHAATGTFAGVKLPGSIRLHAAGSSYCVETSAGDRVWHATRHAIPAAGAC